MTMRFIASFFVNSYRGLGFWTGFNLRNAMIQTLSLRSQSWLTDIFIGLSVVVAALLPATAAFQLTQSVGSLDQPEGATLFAVSTWFLSVLLLSFYRFVVVWPRQQSNPLATANEFTTAAFAVLTSKGSTRWKIWGLVLGQAVASGASLYYIDAHAVRSVAALAAVWLPAIAVGYVSALVTISHYADDAVFSRADRAHMGVQLSANLAVVASIVAGLVFYGALLAIGLAVFVVGGLVLWKVFAAQTEAPAIPDLIQGETKSSQPRWQDRSGATHIDAAGEIIEAHSGTLVGHVDDSSRVTRSSGDHVGQVAGDGKIV